MSAKAIPERSSMKQPIQLIPLALLVAAVGSTLLSWAPRADAWASANRMGGRTEHTPGDTAHENRWEAQVAVLLAPSVTLKVLVVTPTGKLAPEARPAVWVVLAPEQLSVPNGVL